MELTADIVKGESGRITLQQLMTNDLPDPEVTLEEAPAKDKEEQYHHNMPSEQP